MHKKPVHQNLLVFSLLMYRWGSVTVPPPLTGPFFIEKRLENNLQDSGEKREVADGQVLVGIRIVKLKKREENNERGNL